MTSCLAPKVQNSSPCQHFLACGGCNFLDFTEQEYRELKKKLLQDLLINEKLSLPKIEWIWVGPHSRRKITFQIDFRNHLGFFAAKTNNIIAINDCFIAEKPINDLIPFLKIFLKTFEQGIITQITATLFDNGLDLIFTIKKELNFSQIQKITNFAKEKNLNISSRFKNEVTPIFLLRKNQISFPNFKINLDSDIFIQATKSGLDAIINICRTEIRQGEKIIDIYAGFGAYTFALQDLAKEILAAEGDVKMVNLINKNATANDLGNKIKAEIHDLFSSPIAAKILSGFDGAIMNPPRNGASPQAIEIAKSNLQKLIYVSCNPQTFLRDAKILIDSGFVMERLYALDQFYATRHLEVVGIFNR